MKKSDIQLIIQCLSKEYSNSSEILKIVDLNLENSKVYCLYNFINDNNVLRRIWIFACHGMIYDIQAKQHRKN